MIRKSLPIAAFNDARRPKYVVVLAGILLIVALAPGLQRHVMSRDINKVVFDAENLTLPAEAPPSGLCGAMEQQALQDCDRLMEATWYDGGAIQYQREQHLKDFPRCQALSANLFHSCANYGH